MTQQTQMGAPSPRPLVQICSRPSAGTGNAPTTSRRAGRAPASLPRPTAIKTTEPREGTSRGHRGRRHPWCGAPPAVTQSTCPCCDPRHEAPSPPHPISNSFPSPSPFQSHLSPSLSHFHSRSHLHPIPSPFPPPPPSHPPRPTQPLCPSRTLHPSLRRSQRRGASIPPPPIPIPLPVRPTPVDSLSVPSSPCPPPNPSGPPSRSPRPPAVPLGRRGAGGSG